MHNCLEKQIILNDYYEFCHSNAIQVYDKVSDMDICPSWYKSNKEATHLELLDFYSENAAYFRKIIEFSVGWNNSSDYSMHILRPVDWDGLMSQHRIENVLEYGCGIGLPSFVCALQGLQVTALDVAKSFAFMFLKYRAQKYKVSLRYIDVITTDFCLVDTYDMIIAMDVIEHVLDPLKLLSHFWQHLKMGGILYCTHIYRTSAEKKGQHSGLHLFNYPFDLYNNMEKIGFKVSNFDRNSIFEKIKVKV